MTWPAPSEISLLLYSTDITKPRYKILGMSKCWLYKNLSDFFAQHSNNQPHCPLLQSQYLYHHLALRPAQLR